MAPGDSKGDIHRELSQGLGKVSPEVQEVVFTAIDWAELGERHPATKPLRGFGGAGVVEVVDTFKGDAYRFVYTAKFPNAVYGLHAFKKKSTRGIATPKHEIDVIKLRLKVAEQHSRG